MKILAFRLGKTSIIFGMMAATICALSVLGFLAVRDPRWAAEHILSYKFSRPVTIGTLDITDGKWIGIEFKDVHLGNATWGTEPDMVSIGHLTAEVNSHSFFHGPLILRNVAIDDATLFLERNKDGGDANWHFGKVYSSRTRPEDAAEKSRSSLPTPLSLAVHNSKFRMRTSSGHIISIAFTDLNLRADGEDRPVTLTVAGKYNEVPVHLDIQTQSFAALHDSKKPFHAAIMGDAATVSVALKTDMMDPLNFEGTQGELHINVKKIGAAAALFGNAFDGDVPLEFDSTLSRDKDVWTFTNLHGHSGKTDFANSDVTLAEGARMKPDILNGTLNFSMVDLATILPKEKTKGEWRFKTIDKNAGILIDAYLNAKKVMTGKLGLEDVKLHAKLTPDMVTLSEVSMSAAGGVVEGAIVAKATDPGNDIAIQATMKGVDIAQMWRVLNVDDHLLKGHYHFGVDLKATGETEKQLKSTTQGALVFSMGSGLASKQAIELASLDPKALFNKTSTPTLMTCLLAVATFHQGVGYLYPFRLATQDGTILGLGTLDLGQNTLDISLQTDPHSTAASALDKPIHISGDISSLTITPLVFSGKNMAANQDEGIPDNLPAAIKSIANENGCSR